MNLFEEALEKANNLGIDVIENYDFRSERIKGLYCDGTIALNTNIKTNTEKRCVLEEEISHHVVNVGDIITMSYGNIKEEQKARLITYNKLIGLRGIIKAYEHHRTSLHEMAEFLDVTEGFLRDALNLYEKKYGICVAVDNYIINFVPCFSVTKLL